MCPLALLSLPPPGWACAVSVCFFLSFFVLCFFFFPLSLPSTLSFALGSVCLPDPKPFFPLLPLRFLFFFSPAFGLLPLFLAPPPPLIAILLFFGFFCPLLLFLPAVCSFFFLAGGLPHACFLPCLLALQCCVPCCSSPWHVFP